MNNIEKGLITKRFQTTMIGALFEFEKAFGYLWGHLKEDENDLTSEELKNLDIWENVRHNILNNGNNQLRKCISDLSKNSETTYKYKFFKKGQDYEN